MANRSARAVLWDLDGTLVDSEEHHWLAWRETMACEGVTITRDQFAATFGQRNASILPQWLGAEAAGDRIQRVGDRKEEGYRRLVQTRGIAPLPGTVEWLRRLHDGGWRQAIASSAPRLNVDAVVGALGLAPYFQTIVSAEDVQAGKPDPQVFLVAAARLGVAPERCIVIEDAAAGIEAARRAGMRSVGVHPSAWLDADLRVRSLAELPPDALERLLESTPA